MLQGIQAIATFMVPAALYILMSKFLGVWEVFTKGQIILKGLFGILGFFQKTNEQIRF